SLPFVPVAPVIRIITPSAHFANDSCGLLTHQRSTGTCRKQPTKNAPAEAEKTEKSSGTLTPNAKVIVSANNNGIKPLNNAATRARNPETSAKPNKPSANVAPHADRFAKRCETITAVCYPTALFGVTCCTDRGGTFEKS